MAQQKTVYNLIKNQNGEACAQAIYNYDNGIFDVPNIVNIVKYAGREATKPLLRYLGSLKIVKIEEHGPYEDPFTLLKKAGYDAFYVTSLEQQNSIRKYYAPHEELCTFTDPTRFERFYMIHAIHKDADKLKREDFYHKESRDDDYSKSVISIQIEKNGPRVFIISRYNHAVSNPNNTFNSNPDEIWTGLSASLRQYFGVDFSTPTIEVPKGFLYLDGNLIRYNFQIDDIHFGPDFFIREEILYKLDKSSEIMIDGYILNSEDKTLMSPFLYDRY